MYPTDYNGFDQSTMNDGINGNVIIERIESDAMIKMVFTVQLLDHFNLHSPFAIRHSHITNNKAMIIIIRITYKNEIFQWNLLLSIWPKFIFSYWFVLVFCSGFSSMESMFEQWTIWLLLLSLIISIMCRD